MYITNLRNLLLRSYLQGPDHPTKLRLVRWLSKNWFPTKGIPKRVYPDCLLWLHPRDYIENLLLSGENYEPITLNFIQSNLAKGDSAVFAGVNFGLHVIAAAHTVGDTGKIIGIEPQPSALLRADANIQLNDLSEIVSLVNVGLGSEASFVKMAWSEIHDNSGSASLLKKGRGFTIPLVRLEKVIKELFASVPRLLLLDVEGYEINVLNGLTADTAPELIVIEVQRELMKLANVTEDHLLGKLRELGYMLYTLHGELVNQAGEVIPESNLVGIKSGANVHWVTISNP